MLDKTFNNLILRTGSAIIMLSLFILSLFIVESMFYPLMLGILFGMLAEWHYITKNNCTIWFLGIFLTLPIIALCSIKHLSPCANALIFWYFIVIWSNDTFAMIFGKWLQGPKLAPYISPNKTWSGFCGGVITAAIIGVSLYTFIAVKYNVELFGKGWTGSAIFLMTLTIAAIAQMSDLSISIVKRKFKVKDSGTFIPGHGGFLDRFDSIVITAPILWIGVNWFFYT
jgi:phosphatidate cytidylyltransferase